MKHSKNTSEVILEAAVVGLPSLDENASKSEESLDEDSDQKRSHFQKLFRNSHNLRCLSPHGRIDDVDEGAASPTDGRDQQQVQRLLGSQQVGSVPLTDSLGKYVDLS